MQAQPAAVESATNEFPIDVEFENAWETTSDWNEDDDEAAQEENELCFPHDTPAKSSRREREPDATMDTR
jgi:CTD kinase subunit gamma